MALVIDASIAAIWFLPDEKNPAAEQALESLREATATVPSLFWFEIRNILVKAERRKRLEAQESARAMQLLRQLPIEDAGTGDDSLILTLCSRHGLSAYDASYLALALEAAASIATADTALAAAARREQISIFT